MDDDEGDNHDNSNDDDQKASIGANEESDAETESKQQEEDFVWRAQELVYEIVEASRYTPRHEWNPHNCRALLKEYEQHLSCIIQQQQQQQQQSSSSSPSSQEVTKFPQEDMLVSSNTATKVFQLLLKCQWDTPVLSVKVRHTEKLLGQVGRTALTERLSFKLLEVNGKAGNMGRSLRLLQLRQPYEPTPQEFRWAVQSIVSAGLRLRRNERNIFVGDEERQPELDNPTRWLDAILLQMHNRNAPLSIELANQMLHTFCTTGKNGKALHHFYTVRGVPNNDNDDETKQRRVKVKWKRPPRYYKIPSEAKGQVYGVDRKSRLEHEMRPSFSLALTAAFGFAESLQHGTCGHDPIALDLVSYNTLIKACCYRGALCRAMHVLEDMIPQAGLQPDIVSYNTVLEGLARVGDTTTMSQYFLQMTNQGIPIDEFTVQVRSAIVCFCVCVQILNRLLPCFVAHGGWHVECGKRWWGHYVCAGCL